jgi:hypothetical protein
MAKKAVTNERNSIRPTLTESGVVILVQEQNSYRKSFAKISMRLVPNQEWEHITELFTNISSIAPDSVTVKVTPHHGGQLCNPY